MIARLIMIMAACFFFGTTGSIWAAADYSGSSGNDPSSVTPGLSKEGLSSGSGSASGSLDSGSLGTSYKQENGAAPGLSQDDLTSPSSGQDLGGHPSQPAAHAPTPDPDVLESDLPPIKGGLSKQDAIARAEQWALTSNPPMSATHSEAQAVYLKDENVWIVDFIDQNNAEYMLRVEAASGKDPDLLRGSQVQRYKSNFVGRE